MKKDGPSWVHVEPLTRLHENSIPESVCHDFWPGLITLPRAWVNICKLNERTRGFFFCTPFLKSEVCFRVFSRADASTTNPRNAKGGAHISPFGEHVYVSPPS